MKDVNKISKTAHDAYIRHEISALAHNEARFNNINKPYIHSYVEGYGILKEELEEVREELAIAIGELESFWRLIRNDSECTESDFIHKLEQMYVTCLNVAHEAIQAQSVALKTIIQVREIKKESN